MGQTIGVGIQKPNNLSAQGVSGGLLRTAWANDIYMESLQHEPFFNAAGLIETVKVGNDGYQIPTKAFMNVTPSGKDSKAARDVILSFCKSLSGTGRFGNGEAQLEHEEQIALKYAKFYSNDWSHAVSGESFGIDFRELTPYQIYIKAKPLLAQWFGELNGYFAREALCETRCLNLTKSPVSLSQPLNPNWYIPSVATANQPAYAVDANTLEQRVGNLLAGTTAANMHLTIPELLKLSDYANDKYIKQMNINGYDVHCLLVHPDEYRYLLDPSNSTSWGKYWVDAAALNNDLNKVIPGMLGVINESLVVIRDRRCPTIALGGTSGTWAAALGYMKPGRNDTRATGRTSNVHFNANMLLGANCLAKYEPETPHYEEQYDEYDKYYGVGYFGAFSWQIPIWDVDTPKDWTAQQESSMIVPTQR
jgi:hypothetical protein